MNMVSMWCEKKNSIKTEILKNNVKKIAGLVTKFGISRYYYKRIRESIVH